ncbi:hypothetical protein BV898_14752 [Hypsibius exemplaris]|uniref:Uncharacterized protein n=1 Tax=Hypsibius exemplaris TaxID=2072580 RepID=A0A9X6NIY9_HYPEX|nr:hypothetical protein BV898_14752 [Hypsibius exemplaris]
MIRITTVIFGDALTNGYATSQSAFDAAFYEASRCILISVASGAGLTNADRTRPFISARQPTSTVLVQRDQSAVAALQLDDIVLLRTT